MNAHLLIIFDRFLTIDFHFFFLFTKFFPRSNGKSTLQTGDFSSPIVTNIYLFSDFQMDTPSISNFAHIDVRNLSG